VGELAYNSSPFPFHPLAHIHGPDQALPLTSGHDIPSLSVFFPPSFSSVFLSLTFRRYIRGFLRFIIDLTDAAFEIAAVPLELVL